MIDFHQIRCQLEYFCLYLKSSQTMKKILVPCDFSGAAENAFRFALDVAVQSKGEVHLLNVIELPVVHNTFLVPVVSFEQVLLDELREASTKEFQKLIDKYRHDHIKVTAEVLFGPVSSKIIDYASEKQADVIIMGSHGTSGLKGYFIGSNAEKIVRISPVPVLVVKDYPEHPIKNIVFPNSLETAEQENLIMNVISLQEFFKARLHIVRINTPANFSSDTITRKRLEEFAGRYKLKDYTINIFNHPNEENGVIHFAQLVNADLIAMGTHGRRGLAHWLNGSVTEDIVNHIKCPIWTSVVKK